MSNILLSLILPVFNVQKYIEKCILSCINQHNVVLGRDYEIIIVNDGTPDNSMEIVNCITKSLTGITIINQDNQGLSMARNNGLKVAKGYYIWFIDSDDWIEKDAVSIIISKIKDNQFDVVKIRAYNEYPNGMSNERQLTYDDNFHTSGKIEGPKSFGETPAQFNILKRDWLKTYNLWFMSGVYHEDNEFTPRMYWFAKDIGFINKPLYHYLQNPVSITKTSYPKKSYDLIKVCNSLDSFIGINSVKADKRFFIALSSFISMTINSAFYNISSQSKSEQKRFDEEFHKNRNLIKYLFLSRVPKYILEGILWHLFHHYTSIYKLLKSFG